MTGRGSGRQRLLFIAIAAAILLLLAGPSVAAAAAAAPAATGCECGPEIVDFQRNPLKVTPGKQPVLLIHGINGDPIGTWSGKGSLAEKLENDKNYVVGRFDYSAVNHDWVTDPGPQGQESIAKKLAAVIDCMARNAGKKVILVGYSMGGLASQAALAENGVERNVAGLISVGTPWKGTYLHPDTLPYDRLGLSIGPRPDLAGDEFSHFVSRLEVDLCRAILTVEAGEVLGYCYVLGSMRSAAGQAMGINPVTGKPSLKLQDLRENHPIPAGIEVFPVAGQIQGGLFNRLFDFGDRVVGTGSATEPAGGTILGRKILRCAASAKHRVKDRAHPPEKLEPCWHGNLPISQALAQAPEVWDTTERWRDKAKKEPLASPAGSSNTVGGCGAIPPNSGQPNPSQPNPGFVCLGPSPENCAPGQPNPGQPNAGGNGNSGREPVRIELKRIYTRDANGSDTSTLRCGGSQVQLAALVYNSSSSAVKAVASVGVYDPGLSLYQHRDTFDVNVTPGLVAFYNSWIPDHYVNGAMRYDFELSWPDGTITDKFPFKLAFDPRCAQPPQPDQPGGQPGQADVAFDHSSGPPGDVVTGGGSDFHPNRAVTIRSDVIAGGGATAWVDAQGNFDFEFRIADRAPPGYATIVFEQAPEISVSDSTFQVTACDGCPVAPTGQEAARKAAEEKAAQEQAAQEEARKAAEEEAAQEEARKAAERDACEDLDADGVCDQEDKCVDADGDGVCD